MNELTNARTNKPTNKQINIHDHIPSNVEYSSNSYLAWTTVHLCTARDVCTN